jgi:hypothetical protein
MSISTDLSLESDHHLLSTSINLQSSDTAPTPPPIHRIWDVSRLQETEPAELYEFLFATTSEPLLERLRDLVKNPSPSTLNIDKLAKELNELIYDALNNSVGDRSPLPKRWKWVWSTALADAEAHRDYFYRKWRRAVGLEKADLWLDRQEAHLAFRRDLKAARRRACREFCDALERDSVMATSTSRPYAAVADKNIPLYTQMVSALPQ